MLGACPELAEGVRVLLRLGSWPQMRMQKQMEALSTICWPLREVVR